MPGAEPWLENIEINLLIITLAKYLTILQGENYYFHFIDEDTESR